MVDDDGQQLGVLCNGGVALGALALGDEDAYADLCAYVLEKGLLAIENSITHFAPDGAWYEDRATGTTQCGICRCILMPCRRRLGRITATY